MYRSRLFMTNGVISFELDALNGEPLAFVREDRADNARKNHIREITGILDGEIFLGDTACHLNIPRYAQISHDSSLTPTVTVTQGDGEANAVIDYPYLVANGKKVDVSAHVTVTLLPGDCRSYWSLRLQNRTEHEITTVSFPELSGLWLGDSWEDDTLVLPRVSGSKLENPTKIVSSPETRIYWKWQEYTHIYRLNRNGTRDDRGLYFYRCPYTGGGSMLWLDLYNRKENSGIYLTCRDEKMRFSDVHVSTLGEYCPGVGLGVQHNPCLKKGTWESPQGILAFHEGDWHWAADTYRAMRETYGRPLETAMPQWFKTSPGLAAHYDFRYQGGGIVHKFCDIPALYEKAKTWGMDHLLLAGWNTGGFDYGFPHYTPDEELGGAAGLKTAVEEVHRLGGRVTFYVNSRLCNAAFRDEEETIKTSAVMRRNGSLRLENYGAGDVEFASLCMNESGWRRRFADAIRFLLQDMGGDGIYLDQLSMAKGMTCYHPGHTEHAGDPAAWNQGYEKLLDTLRKENPGKAIFYEGCNDIYGRGVTGQLISTLRQVRDGVTPELYRYTFPNEVLLDMENPRRHSGMRAEHIARRSTFYLYRGFVCGLYFWVYDLEDDNTFSRDPEQEERLKKAAALRSLWLKTYGYGTFRDQTGLLSVAETDLIKRYDLDDGRVLLALAAEGGIPDRVRFDWDKPTLPQVTIHTPENPAPVAAEARKEENGISVALPKTELCILILQ